MILIFEQIEYFDLGEQRNPRLRRYLMSDDSQDDEQNDSENHQGDFIPDQNDNQHDNNSSDDSVMERKQASGNPQEYDESKTNNDYALREIKWK